MSSKILLINFTEKEAIKLRALPLVFDRGFLSDEKKLTKKEAVHSSYTYNEESKEESIRDLDFYTPHPVYEYNAVFINLQHKNNLEDEFKEKTRKLTKEDRNDFVKYWFIKSYPIVVFLGDYNLSNLRDIGISSVNLKKVVNKDIALNSRETKKEGSMISLCNEIKSGVIMPTHKYIQFEEKSILTADNTDYKTRYLYWNNNGEELATYVNYDKGYSEHDRPLIIIFPQFRDNALVVEKTLRLLARLSPKSFPELPHSDWIDSDQYYPLEVADYDKQIGLLIDKTRAEIKELKEKKKGVKNKYNTLRGLLTQTGDELKSSVIDILSNVFKLDVIDADEENDNLPNEDVLINFNDTKILAEVKGVKAQNPSPLFIGQVWKHISQSKDKGIKKGALILNHDRETDPSDRSLAYKGEHEGGLDDIIFIDTRVMFGLALAIIDFGLSPEEAISVLLQDGRVTFDLKEYIDTKSVGEQREDDK